MTATAIDSSATCQADVICRCRVSYINPLAYADTALVDNEFRSTDWDAPSPFPGEGLGDAFLRLRGFSNSEAWIWGAMLFMAGAIALTHAATVACLQWLSGGTPRRPVLPALLPYASSTSALCWMWHSMCCHRPIK
jgi:hypothetical protein